MEDTKITKKINHNTGWWTLKLYLDGKLEKTGKSSQRKSEGKIMTEMREFGRVCGYSDIPSVWA